LRRGDCQSICSEATHPLGEKVSDNGELNTLQQMLEGIAFEDNVFVMQVGVRGHEELQFTVATQSLPSLRYAAALLATGNVQLAESLLKEH
jgi:hypothetical protein